MSAAFLMVTTTLPGPDEARALAHTLVEARLAACVQILPIESVYRWQGAVESAAEHLLLCKVRADDYAAVESAIRERHPYDVPEIVAVAITAGAQPYLDWLGASTAR